MPKPVPQPTAESRHYWEGCNERVLRYQRCLVCGKAQFYPRLHCATCQSLDLSWEQSAGEGSVHTFTIVRRPGNRAFDADVPYVLALVDLDEGYRMMMNVIGDDALATTIGARVRIVFMPAENGQLMPQAVLAG